MEIKEWVRAARAHKGWNQTQLGEAVGRTKANIGHWETGKHAPSVEQVAQISNATGYPLPPMGAQVSSIQDFLSSEVGEPLAIKSMRLLPLVGEVKGGDDGYLEEFQYPVGHGEGLIEYPTSDPNAYALRVRGDSMHPRYRAGEFVVVEPNIEWQEGDDVVVAFTNGRKMLKQINWRRDGEVQLLSINNGYAPLTLPLRDIESIQLVAGRARRSALRTK